MKNRVYFFLTILFLVSQVFAQTPEPEFANKPTAKKSRAEGICIVKVLINESGKVVSAKGISGLPILCKAAEEATLKARFLPTVIGGVAVKVTGNITYNFVKDLTWIQIGAYLSEAENSLELTSNFPASSIKAKFPKDWENETTLAQKLVDEASKKSDSHVKKDKKSKVDTKNHRNTVIELKSLLHRRLADSAIKIWYFNLGLKLGVQSQNINNLKNYLGELGEFEKNASTDVSPTIINILKELNGFSHKTTYDETDKAKIQNLIKQIIDLDIDIIGETKAP